MQHRKPYCDMGLVIAAGIFVCVVIKSLLFGFTWINGLWLLMAIGYFYLSWKLDSHDKKMKHATTAFITLSLVAMFASAMLDQNIRPVMHAFEGRGDTIAEYAVHEEVAEQVPAATIDSVETDSVSADTLSPAEHEETIADGEKQAASENDSTYSAE